MHRASSVILAMLIGACGTASPAPTPLAMPATTPSPPPATSGPARTGAPRVLVEAEAWSEVRGALPGVPLIVPTWLPASLDRTRVELREVAAGADPRYTIAYIAPDGADVVFALGPAGDVTGSGAGTRVRNSPAVLSFDSALWSTPVTPSLRRIRWMEGPYVLRIDTDRFTGEDLMHIAWSLDRTGQPPPKNPHTRAKPGACAAAGAPPEATVGRLIGLLGSGDRDAVSDCIALELLGEYPGYGAWSELPRANDFSVRSRQEVGGRVVIGASWRFATDPGGAWNQQAHHFFLLGLEDAAWRVYETATGWVGTFP